jgi:phosphoribosylanthranilate isomerase
MPLFRVKICGVTSPTDAENSIAAGADALGLNFYTGSSRFVDAATASAIAKATAGRALRVGVFVNAPAVAACHACDHIPLDAIQIHGDEPATYHAALGDRRVIRALRVDAANAEAAVRFIRELQALGTAPSCILIDARHGDSYGGQGRAADWTSAAWLREQIPEMPVALAGGLTSDNVAAAIRAVLPDGVDVASGVESRPGQKDAAKVRAFVDAAREAWAEAAA